jgi:hypothetical protein
MVKLTPVDKDVMKFVSRFTDKGRRREVVECFTQGCCYWFALALSARFGGRLVYDQTVGHFASEIGGVVYDITGPVNGKWTYWLDLCRTEPNVARNVRENCIGF